MELSCDWSDSQWRHCIDCPAHVAPRGPSKISLSLFLFLSSLFFSLIFFLSPRSFFSSLSVFFSFARKLLRGGLLCQGDGRDSCWNLSYVWPPSINHLRSAWSLHIFLRVICFKHASIFEIHSRNPRTYIKVLFTFISFFQTDCLCLPRRCSINSLNT